MSGYVFFPKGQYNQIEMLLVDRETGDTEVVREPGTTGIVPKPIAATK